MTYRIRYNIEFIDPHRADTTEYLSRAIAEKVAIAASLTAYPQRILAEVLPELVSAVEAGAPDTELCRIWNAEEGQQPNGFIVVETGSDEDREFTRNLGRI